MPRLNGNIRTYRLGDFNSYDSQYSSFWYGSDFVRVAEYWEKRPVKRTLALHRDGSVEDLTDRSDAEIAEATAAGAQIRKRDGFKVFRSLITLGHTLEEPEEWQGRMIPIVPLIGKEIRIGRKTIRYGVVRFAKDPQRRFNFFTSTEAEVLGLAPKSPWIGTKKNFQDAEDKWTTANTVNHPYLEYTPDPLNGGSAPQRVAPPIGSSGLSDAVDRADLGMKATTGIYDARSGPGVTRRAASRSRPVKPRATPAISATSRISCSPNDRSTASCWT